MTDEEYEELLLETARANGIDLPPKPEQKAKKSGGSGANKEWMDYLVLRRKVTRLLPDEVKAQRGKGRKTKIAKQYEKLSPEEKAYVDAKLDELEPRAIAVLERQMESEDERVAQRAAQLLLEWKRGKPSQTVKQEGQQIHTIRYESAAWQPLNGHGQEEVVDADFLELEAPAES